MKIPKSAEGCRKLYRKIRLRSQASTLATFDAACAALGPTTPQEWVQAALTVAFPCGRCAGTGEFVTGTVNGKPTGPGGRCYRCGGKGAQNDADVRRNDYYDTHRPVYV